MPSIRMGETQRENKNQIESTLLFRELAMKLRRGGNEPRQKGALLERLVSGQLARMMHYTAFHLKALVQPQPWLAVPASHYCLKVISQGELSGWVSTGFLVDRCPFWEFQQRGQ